MRHSPPYNLEVIGLPAAGKSTLVKALLETSEEIAPAWRFRQPAVVPAVVLAILRHLPDWLLLKLAFPRSHQLEMGLLFSLVVQHHFYLLGGWSASSINLLDQGPVFCLMRIRADAPALLEHRAGRRIYRHCMRVWSARLDCIVRLDEDDETLYQRIHSREQNHRMSGHDRSVARDFFTRVRAAYQLTVDEMTACSEIRVLDMVSSESSTADSVNRVLQQIDMKDDGRRANSINAS